MTWGLFEIISTESWANLVQYQADTHGALLDAPLVEHPDEATIKMRYTPDDLDGLEAVDRAMRSVIGEVSPIRTEGI